MAVVEQVQCRARCRSACAMIERLPSQAFATRGAQSAHQYDNGSMFSLVQQLLALHSCDC